MNLIKSRNQFKITTLFLLIAKIILLNAQNKLNLIMKIYLNLQIQTILKNRILIFLINNNKLVKSRFILKTRITFIKIIYKN